MKSIGIIGQGFVGSAVREKMKDYFTVYTYDKYNRDNCLIYRDETIIMEEVNIDLLVKNCEIIFVCVPTPMFEDGECDTRIVRSVIEDLAESAESQDRNVITVLKSTVPPGTTRSLNEISKKVGVSFSPEFLTEANAINDFKNQKRIVLGIDWAEYMAPVVDVFSTSFPDAEIFTVNSDEAEMVKYMTNLFLATKVSFFNDMYQICQKMDINYDQVVNVTLADPRIGKSHYRVPGPDGDLGYGGHCFPGSYQILTTCGTISLSDAYEKINSGEFIEALSFNHTIDSEESKIIDIVTKNEYSGDLYKFTMEDGSVIECTPDHIFPILRNNKLVLLMAKDIINTDEFFNRSEINNKKTLTSNANKILRP